MTESLPHVDEDDNYAEERLGIFFANARLLYADSLALISEYAPISIAAKDAAELALVTNLIIESEHYGRLAQRIMLDREQRFGAERAEREFNTVVRTVKLDESLNLLSKIELPDFSSPQENREEKSSDIPPVDNDKL